MLKQRLILGVSSLALASVISTNVVAQGAIDEIVVTARKKSESLQDVPIAVSALGEQQLDELGVDVFTDYLAQLPGVTAGGFWARSKHDFTFAVWRPQRRINNRWGCRPCPNVALYLDEQPLTQPGRNLDVYAVDMERIEVLTLAHKALFGASSQAGVVRLITNKPRIGEYSLSVRGATSVTKDGDDSNKVEIVTNIPINDRMAIRAVVYGDQQGGYIDNVAPNQAITAKDSARFRAQGTMRSNGVPVSAKRTGFQGGADLSQVTAEAADNSDRIADNINDTEYSGIRLGVL